MIGDQRVLGIVPARGGSKGVPRKNLRPLAGASLLARAVRAALAAASVDEVVVSSEDDEILAAARNAGATPLRRPAFLAQDDTPGIDPVLHAVQAVGDGYGWICCLQPTSPFRTAEHIDAAARLLHHADADSCVSVVRPAKHPAWMYERATPDPEAPLRPLLRSDRIPARRQDLPEVFALNGAIYLAGADGLLREGSLLWGRCVGYEMEARASLDIDTEEDLLYAEFLLSREAT